MVDLTDAIVLNNKSISGINIKDVKAYLLVGGHPGNLMGAVFVFLDKGDGLIIYGGNVYQSCFDVDILKLLLKDIESFDENLSIWHMSELSEGWKEIPFCMGHYVYIRDYLYQDFVHNNKINKSITNHMKRLIVTMNMICEKPEKIQNLPTKLFSCQINIDRGTCALDDFDVYLANILRKKTNNDTWVSYTDIKERKRKEAIAKENKITVGTDDKRIFIAKSGIPVEGEISLEDYIKYDVEGIVKGTGIEIKNISLNKG